MKGKGREKKKWQMYRKPNQRMVTQQPEGSILETTSQTTTETKAKAEMRRGGRSKVGEEGVETMPGTVSIGTI